jgi:hypothetical protein
MGCVERADLLPATEIDVLSAARWKVDDFQMRILREDVEQILREAAVQMVQILVEGRPTGFARLQPLDACEQP